MTMETETELPPEIDSLADELRDLLVKVRLDSEPGTDAEILDELGRRALHIAALYENETDAGTITRLRDAAAELAELAASKRRVSSN